MSTSQKAPAATGEPRFAKTPPWALPISLGAMLVGLATVFFGPMVLYAIASARANAVMAEEGRFDVPFQQEAREAAAKQVVDDYVWVFPVGCALGFAGLIGLMLIWVSRPLGSDEDSPAEPPVSDSAEG